MSVFDRMWGALVGREEPTPTQLTGPVQRRDSVSNPITGLGGLNDKGAVARPSTWTIPLDDDELQALHANNGLSRQIIELPPTRATRKGWTAPDIGLTVDRTLGVLPKTCEAMVWSRTFGGSGMVLVTEDDVPPSFRRRPQDWLAQPINLQRIGALHSLQVFDAFEASPREIERDIRSPNYRNPKYWSISAEGFAATIHASRIVYFRGARRPSSRAWGGWRNRMPDASVLQAVYDEIGRLTQTMQGGATLAQELRMKVLKLGNFEALMTGDQRGLLQTQLSLMGRLQNLLGLSVIGPSDEYENQSNPPTGFKDLSDAQQEMLCIVLGWPRTMLNGESPGALGSGDESGLERERQIISDFQEVNRPQIEQIYTAIYASQDGPTGGRIPDEWEVKFYPLNEPKEKETAELRKLTAETDAIYIQSGVYSPADVAESRFGGEGWSIDLLEVQVPDADEEALLDAARLAMSEPPPEDEPTEVDERADAEPSACLISLPAADPGLSSAVERAIGQSLTIEDEPHVTILYLGEGLTDAEIAEVVQVAKEEARTTEPATLDRGSVRAFPHGAEGTPIVVEYSEAWSLGALHDRLLRRLAHLIRARQHPRFRPHVTIGYAPKPLSAEAATALLGVDASAVRVPVGELRIHSGRDLVATVPV